MEEKQTIKIDFCGFWGSFNKKDNLFYNVLSKRFNVEIAEKPDFVICSNRGKPFEYMKYDCVRIMFAGENVSPDFTVFDYFIGFDKISFDDRYFCLPFAFYFDNGEPLAFEKITQDEAKKLLNEKRLFCNFIYGHQSSHGVREKLFATIDKYKRVASPGRFLNNMGTNGCSWQEKYGYLRDSKFTIACDSIEHKGFITEKIMQAFQNHSIPVYFGDPEIDDYFNEKAFVWCKGSSEKDIEEAVERVKYLDAHDDEYIKMLAEYPLKSEDLINKKYQELEKFLFNVFSQEPEKACRRVKHFAANLHELYLKECMNKHSKDGLLTKIKKMIKRK